MISDLEARIIASEWHGGMSSALYALTSSGAIDEFYAIREINDSLAYATGDGKDSGFITDEDIDNLNNLLEYVQNTGERDPVEGWSELSW